MNKYEEAMKKAYSFNQDVRLQGLKELEELVKRYTPTKPIEKTKMGRGFIGKCPQCDFVCNGMTIEDVINYCHICGQCIDWSEGK